MASFENLKKFFSDLPGIGPRQAERFVYFLLDKEEVYLNNFGDNIKSVKKDFSKCPECMRYFIRSNNDGICKICSNPNRDKSVLMIVAKDKDLETIESSGVFEGEYFVLGGLIPILDKTPHSKIRLKELENKIKKLSPVLKEIIIALNATHEGEHTEIFIKNELQKSVGNSIKISHLGRGLSTGLEIEYSDPDTIREALKNKSEN